MTDFSLFACQKHRSLIAITDSGDMSVVSLKALKRQQFLPVEGQALVLQRNANPLRHIIHLQQPRLALNLLVGMFSFLVIFSASSFGYGLFFLGYVLTRFPVNVFESSRF